MGFIKDIKNEAINELTINCKEANSGVASTYSHENKSIVYGGKADLAHEITHTVLRGMTTTNIDVFMGEYLHKVLKLYGVKNNF